MGSLRDREVACSASYRQGSNFESCVWRTVSSHSSHHPQEVLLAQFSLYVHKGGLKPDSFNFIGYLYVYWLHFRFSFFHWVLIYLLNTFSYCVILRLLCLFESFFFYWVSVRVMVTFSCSFLLLGTCVFVGHIFVLLFSVWYLLVCWHIFIIFYFYWLPARFCVIFSCFFLLWGTSTIVGSIFVYFYWLLVHLLVTFPSFFL